LAYCGAEAGRVITFGPSLRTPSILPAVPFHLVTMIASHLMWGPGASLGNRTQLSVSPLWGVVSGPSFATLAQQSCVSIDHTGHPGALSSLRTCIGVLGVPEGSGSGATSHQHLPTTRARPRPGGSAECLFEKHIGMAERLKLQAEVSGGPPKYRFSLLLTALTNTKTGFLGRQQD